MIFHRLPITLVLLLAPLDRAAATGALDRLRGVSEHARERAGAAPEHLWLGISLAALVLMLIAGAACWSRWKKKV